MALSDVCAQVTLAAVVTDEVENALTTLPALARRFSIRGYPTILALAHGVQTVSLRDAAGGHRVLYGQRTRG